jgi:hypothetical protein
MPYRLKPGAPPDDELYVSVSLMRTWKPKLGPDHYPAIDEQDTDDGVEIPEPTNMLEAMLYDKLNIDNGYSGIEEILESYAENDDPDQGEVDFTQHTWEIVDKHGTVWSEEYDNELFPSREESVTISDAWTVSI